MEISINWNICRICLQEEKLANGGQMRCIFNEGKKLAQHIYDCSGITIKPNDSLPDKICQKCSSVLNIAINFRKTCRSSNTYLESVLQRTKSASFLFKSERFNIEYNDKGKVELETLKESEVSIENCIEHSPEAIDKNKCLDIIVGSNIESSEDVNNLVKSEINYKKDIQLCEVLEHSEEIDAEITPIHEKANNSISTSKYLATNEKSQRISDNDYQNYADYIYETDIEQLEENIEEVYGTNNYILEDDLNNKDESETITENNFECLDMEENNLTNNNVMLRLEEHEVDENQDKVSSTVHPNNVVLNLHAEQSKFSNVAYPLTKTKNCKEDENFYNKKEYFSQHTNVFKSNTIPTESRKIRGLKNITVRTSKVALFRNNIKHKNFDTFSDSRRYQLLIYICKTCGTQFSNRHYLNLHRKKHRQERNHQCELCFKCFFTASNLQAHMRIHTGEKPFECQYCGRRFSDRSSNLRHERIHTNEKPFQCNICGKSFALATTLQSHIKIHTGERSYRCEPCGKSFKLPHHLKSHQMTTLHKAVEQLGNKYN